MLLERWRRLSKYPLGPWIFGRLLARMVPYTGTISPRIVEIEAGFARVRMRDTRRVRNHLRSLHAVALLNLSEVTSGLAMMAGLPRDARAIVSHLSIEFVKKGRGTVEAVCRCTPPADNSVREFDLTTELTDAAGDVVARGTARWKVGPQVSPAATQSTLRKTG